MEYEETYPHFLELKLKERGREINALNAGVPGYTSFQTRNQFDQIADQVDPDIVIVYSSNNETSLAAHSDAELFQQGRRLMKIREFFLRFFWFQFLKDSLVPPKPFKMLGSIDLPSLLGKPARVSLEDYRKNIIHIVQLARKKGILPILVSVPNSSGHPFLLIVPHANPEVNNWVSSAQQLLEKAHYPKALALLEKVQTSAPDYYQLHYLKGKIYHGCFPSVRELLRLLGYEIVRTSFSHCPQSVSMGSFP